MKSLVRSIASWFGAGEERPAVSGSSGEKLEPPRDRERPDALVREAESAASRGDLESAQELLLRALDEGADPAFIHYRLGVLQFGAGYFDEAAESFQLALHFRPDLAAGWSDLGVTRLRQRRFEEALEAAESALALGGPFHAAVNRVAALRGLGRFSEASEAASEASGKIEAYLESNPGDAEAVRNLASLAVQQDDMESAARHYARHEELQTGVRPSLRVCAVSKMNPALAAAGEPYVACLDDVLVDTASWAVIEGGRLYFHETQDRAVANAPFVAGRVSADGKRMILSIPEAPERIAEPCVLLGGDGNYSHWITRNLIKLCLLEKHPELQGLRLLINEDLRAYQREFLELLDISESRLLKVGPGSFLRCARLHVPTLLRHHPRMPDGVAWLRSRLAELLGTGGAPERLLYVSRLDTGLRRLENEEEIIGALEPLGFSAITPGRMSVREQIRAFSAARLIVGPHGAGLTNVIFAPPEASIIELTSERIAHMLDFRTIAECLGQRYLRLISRDFSAEKLGSNPMHQGYRMNLPEVLTAVRRFLG